MAKVNVLSGMTIASIGSRQLAARGPASKGKPTQCIKRKSIPSHTKAWCGAAVAFGEAAHSALGGTMEDVIAAVVRGCSGKDHGGAAAKAARRETRLARYSGSMAKLKAGL